MPELLHNLAQAAWIVSSTIALPLLIISGATLLSLKVWDTPRLSRAERIATAAAIWLISYVLLVLVYRTTN